MLFRSSILSLTITSILAGTAIFSMPTTSFADEGVEEVYVYNGGADNKGTNDGFNSASQGWIFTQMGLLGPNGEVPTVNGDDELVLPDGTVVGSVLRGDPDPNDPDDPGPIVGYENADGSKRAYNVDTEATTEDAWNDVDDNGELIIAKHGVRYVNREGETTGTGLTLDDGKTYGGIVEEDSGDTGTGVSDDPYEFPGRPGAGIGVYLNGCYTSKDADGDGEGRSSATDSVKGVDGVDGDRVRGNEGIIYKGINVSVWTDAEWAALQACAKAAGFMKKSGTTKVPDVAGWIMSMPFPDQRKKAVECLTNAGIDPADITLSISYNKTDEGSEECESGDGLARCNYYEPVTSFGPEGGYLVFNPSPDHEMIQVEFLPLSLQSSDPILIHPVALEHEQLQMLPPGLEPATAPINVRRYDGDPMQLQQPALLFMTFDPQQPIVDFVILTDNGFQPYPAQIDPAGFIVTEIFHDGTWFAIQEQGQQQVPGDVNSDGIVDVNDLLELLQSWGFCPGCPADLDNNGSVDVNDLLILLSNWS